MNTISYKHQDQVTEQDRLVQQFQREWPWEKETLRRLGIIPTLSPVLNALSYGCGVGIDAATLSKEGYATYVEGWDTSEKMVERAKRQYGHPNLVFRHLNLAGLHFIPIDRKFDLVYCRLVLLHNKIGIVPQILKQCTDMMNDGGLLVVHDVDKSRDSIIPGDHEFNLITREIHNYLVRCGNSPKVGALVPQLFAEIGLRNIQSEVVEQVRNFEETKTDLAYCLNVQDDAKVDGRLISKEMWKKACKNKVPSFERKTFRVISVGQK